MRGGPLLSLPSLSTFLSRCCGSRPSSVRSEVRRVIYLNHTNLNSGFPTNRVENTKFTSTTFLPLMLRQQFSAPMSLYFLLIATLQLWRTIAPVHPMTSWAPLIVVFLVTCVKEAYDDSKRRSADDAANARAYAVWSCGALKPACASQDICVGDLVRVADGEEVPCDLLLLRASDACLGGVAQVETANLDGETDLKPRRAHAELQALRVEELAGMQGKFECEPPNADLYRFEASLQLLGGRPGGGSGGSGGLVGELSVGRDQLLQGGSVVRRSGWVVGMAVYTGGHTKLCLNKAQPPTKLARVDKAINSAVVVIFVAQAALVLAFGWAGLRGASYGSGNYWYLGWAAQHALGGAGVSEAGENAQTAMLRSVWQEGGGARGLGGEGMGGVEVGHGVDAGAPPPAPWYTQLILPLRFLLLSSMMIPISLRVSMDLVKAYYALLISRDPLLAHPLSPSAATPGASPHPPTLTAARVANSAITEDLGLVTHVLTDKTGTLTENLMVLRALALPGIEYGGLGGGSGRGGRCKQQHRRRTPWGSI